MKLGTLISTFACLAAMANGQQSQSQAPLSMVFSNSDVSEVLMAISVKTGANIVYAQTKEKVLVTFKLRVATAEEAIKATAAASGMVYRKVGKLFVVAPPEGMRQALQPYSVTSTFTLPEGKADVQAKTLQDVLPDATVRALGNQLMVTGISEDVQRAAHLLEDMAQSDTSRNMTTDVVVVSRASAKQVGDLVKALYPTLQITSSDTEKGGGMIGIAGPGSLVAAAHDMIGKLDVAQGADADPVTFRVYRLKYTSAPALVAFLKTAAPNVEAIIGPEPYSPPRAKFNPLSALLTGSGGNNGTNSGVGQNNNSGGFGGQQQGGGAMQNAGDQKAKEGDQSPNVVLKGTELQLAQAFRIIQEVDTKPMQVMVEVNIAEAAPTFVQSLGIDWGLQNTVKFNEASPGAAGVGFGKFTRSPTSFLATLNASISKGEVKLLANPRVQVVDNHDANVFVGDTVRARLVQNSVLGGQTITIQEFPVGIILLIHPRINADGNITIHVNPVVSTIDSLGTDNVPQTSTREAETTVIIKDGESIVIGGLIRDDYSKVVREVPFLSKLPVVGELFRNRSTTKSRKDVIVTLTPHIVKDAPDK